MDGYQKACLLPEINILLSRYVYVLSNQMFYSHHHQRYIYNHLKNYKIYYHFFDRHPTQVMHNNLQKDYCHPEYKITFFDQEYIDQGY